MVFHMVFIHFFFPENVGRCALFAGAFSGEGAAEGGCRSQDDVGKVQQDDPWRNGMVIRMVRPGSFRDEDLNGTRSTSLRSGRSHQFLKYVSDF